MVMQQPTNYVATKPGFDGRLAFINVMEKAMFLWLQASATRDQQLQYQALRQLHILVSPYVKNENNEEIKTLLSQIQQNLAQKNQNISITTNVQESLNNTAYKVFNYGKHLLLPQDMEDASEPNWDEEME